MYSSDLVEAFVHEQQREILAHAASNRLARLAHGATTADRAQRAPRRSRRPHPVVAFHAWLAAGQL